MQRSILTEGKPQPISSLQPIFSETEPDVSDYHVSEAYALEQYEKFLARYPDISLSLTPSEIEQKFEVFRHNLARISFYNG